MPPAIGGKVVMHQPIVETRDHALSTYPQFRFEVSTIVCSTKDTRKVLESMAQAYLKPHRGGTSGPTYIRVQGFGFYIPNRTLPRFRSLLGSIRPYCNWGELHKPS